ncbi:MAG: antitoxin VbhA family protein [Clostridia bacterium]|nr:antitoxin VbhA family protein [Clostridia bacterium]
MITNDKIVENIKATMAAEGLFLQEKDVSLINQYLNNEITVEQGVDIIKKDVMSKMNNRNV